MIGRASARYAVVRDEAGTPLVIRDLGPWDRHPSVTNDAESVVAELLASGRLGPGRRLLYHDSAGDLDELLHDGERFTGFRPGPARRAVR